MALGIKSLSSAGGWLRPLLSVLGLSVDYLCMVSDSTWTVTWFVSGKRLECKNIFFYFCLSEFSWKLLWFTVVGLTGLMRVRVYSYLCKYLCIPISVHIYICAGAHSSSYLCSLRCVAIVHTSSHLCTFMCNRCTCIFVSVHAHVCEGIHASSYLCSFMCAAGVQASSCLCMFMCVPA